MPYSKRPHLMAVYAPELDQAGHRSGPHSQPVDMTLREMDSFVKDIFKLVDQRNLTEIVDVLVVSDHGMAGELGISWGPCGLGSSEKEWVD